MDGEGSRQSPLALTRADGVTGAERYLKRLCDRTFLSLWSYPEICRDQGQSIESREGKEVCDLLVVFERHIIIFSDKDCQFPQSGNPTLDWKRWFRRAVLKSAGQVWGAERWIKSHPDRLFVDQSCRQRFPVELPEPATAKFHRVVVAHDASRACRRALGGSGSLMIVPSIIGPMHHQGDNVRPFSIGQVDQTAAPQYAKFSLPVRERQEVQAMLPPTARSMTPLCRTGASALTGRVRSVLQPPR
jgi:hypothetical protein